MASPTYCDEAVITLTAINPMPSMPFPKRKMFLSRSNITISIGRTSRRNAQYEAGEKNCWIDSAVMSRDHAELHLDLQQQRIVVRDIGSLHGTFVNTMRLSRNQNHVLQSGDILQFGIPIERGNETYLPCSFEAHVKFGLRSPEKRPMKFTVPDETDIDDLSGDEEDLDRSVDHSSQILRNNFIVPVLPDSGVHQKIVDLTSNDNVVQGKDNFDQHSSSDLEHFMIRSDLSESRMPTPPETLDRNEEDLLFTGSDLGQDEDEDGESDGSQGDLFHDNESQAASADGSLNGDVLLPDSRTIPDALDDGPLDEAPPQHQQNEFEIAAQPKDDVPVDLLGIERDAPAIPTSNPLVDEMDEDVHEFAKAFEKSSLDDTSAYQWEMSKRNEARKAELSSMDNGLVSIRLKSASEPQAMNQSTKRKAEEISGEEDLDNKSSNNNDGQPDMQSPKRFRKVVEVVGYAALGGAAVMGALIATAPTF